MKFKNYLLFLLLIISSACIKKGNRQKRSNQPINIELQKVGYITVKDVECNECAEIVLRQIQSLPSVISAEYEKNNGDYENDRIKVILKINSKLQKEEIQKVLEDEGFGLKIFTLK